MLSNHLFLNTIQTSFKEFINSGTSRSTAKLKPLHGTIAADIAERLGDSYKVWSQGYEEGKEREIEGRYINKMVDITIEDLRAQRPVAGIAVKFVMQNYSQNSNNYFENMLGETANIRSAKYPYFQVFIILDKLPHYKNSGKLALWEEFNDHNMHKYCELSKDNTDMFFHTPNKTLIYVVHLEPEAPDKLETKSDYINFYKENTDSIRIVASTHKYNEYKTGGTIILNDYRTFMEKVYHTVKSL